MLFTSPFVSPIPKFSPVFMSPVILFELGLIGGFQFSSQALYKTLMRCSLISYLHVDDLPRVSHRPKYWSGVRNRTRPLRSHSYVEEVLTKAPTSRHVWLRITYAWLTVGSGVGVCHNWGLPFTVVTVIWISRHVSKSFRHTETQKQRSKNWNSFEH